MAGGMESAASTEAGGEEGGEIAAAEAAVESVNKKGDLLVEESKKQLENKTKKYQNIYYNRLMESLEKDEKIYDMGSLDEDVEVINTKIEQMSKEIDNIIK